MREFLVNKECDWIEFQTNVPSASHMGGIWERQIRTVRNVLNALLDDHGTQLDEESLRTFMCETESIVNSLPLTTDNLTSPNGMEPLTPNHLLTMKSRVLLPPPGEFQREDIYLVKRWRRVQYLVNQFLATLAQGIPSIATTKTEMGKPSAKYASGRYCLN